jgi:chemotaxis protein CheD
MSQTTEVIHPARADARGGITVGVADIALSNDPNATLITYALGSCIGVTVYDPIAKVGGLLHFMLPFSRVNPAKAQQRPAMFGDTGIPLLFRSAYELGARKERLIVCAAGGAEILNDEGHFRVGSRNRTMLRKLFWKNNILLDADETGGNISRTLSMPIGTGTVSIRNRGKEKTLWAA